MWQLGHEIVHAVDGDSSLQDLHHGQVSLSDKQTKGQLPHRNAASLAKLEAAVPNASAVSQVRRKPQVTTATRAKQASPKQV